jgi:predicted phage terminase large subunit-like protein
VVAKLKQHVPHMARFEANNGGDAYCEKVDETLRADGVRINMSTKRAPTTQSKLSRIIQHAPDIKKFYFVDEAHRSKEYRAFMNEVTLFTQAGKNKHDDACDSLAMLVEFLDTRGKTVTVMRRPF